jgi:hypothetical protein
MGDATIIGRMIIERRPESKSAFPIGSLSSYGVCELKIAYVTMLPNKHKAGNGMNAFRNVFIFDVRALISLSKRKTRNPVVSTT